MHTRLLIAASSAFIFFASSSFAQTPVSQSIQQANHLGTNSLLMQSSHPGGWEVGATIGYNRMNTGQRRAAEGNGDRVWDEGNLQWSAHIGYYWPIYKRLLLGVETGYQSFGNAKGSIITPVSAQSEAKVDAWSAMLAARFYLLNRLALFGKLGGAYTWVDIKTTGAINTTEKRQFMNPEWQLGLLVDLSQHLSASIALNQLVGLHGYDNLQPVNPTTMGVLAGLNWDLSNRDIMPMTRSRLGGWEVGATVGYDRVDTGQLGRAAGDGRQYSNYGNAQWGIYGGYYWSVYKRLLLGIETGCQSFGGAQYQDFAALDPTNSVFKTRSIQAWSTLLAARFYLLNNFAVFGKLGEAYTWVNLKTTGDINTSETRQFFNPEWQVGMLMGLSQHLTAMLGFNRLVGSASNATVVAQNPNVMGVFAGLNWDVTANDVLPIIQTSHPGGWELGATVGYNRVDTGQRGRARSTADRYYDYGNAQWGVHGAYYWQVLKRLLLGVETGYESYGGANAVIGSATSQNGDYSSKAYGWNTMLAARFYVLNHLALFGKFGGAYTWMDVKRTNSGSDNTSGTMYHFSPTWALGLLMDIGRHVTATLGFHRLSGAPGTDLYPPDAPNVSGVLVGLNWDMSGHGISPIMAQHSSAWELGGMIGYNRMQSNQSGGWFFPVRSLSNQNIQWGAHIGYYSPLTNRLLIGVESGYQSFGGTKLTAGSDTYKVKSIDAWDALLAARFYVLNRVAVYGKYGAAYTWIDIHTNESATIVNESCRFFNPEWQLGLLVDLGKHLNATLGMTRLAGTGKGDLSTANPAVMGVDAGLNIRF